MTVFKCEFCEVSLQSQSALNVHKLKTKACIDVQIKKLGKPFSEVNKEQKAIEEAKKKAIGEAKKAKKDEKARKEAEKAKIEAEKEKARKEAEKAKIEDEKERNRKAAEKVYIEAEEEIARKAAENSCIKEDDESEEEMDENAEIPFSSDESSSSESEEEPPIVKKIIDNVEEYQRTNPSRLNNLFKRKSTTVKTEIINDDQPAEVHMRKIQEYLPTVQTKVVQEQPKTDTSKEILKMIDDKITLLENKVMRTIETKMNTILEAVGNFDKKMKSIENKLEKGPSVKDIERVIDDKLDDMFSMTTKLLADVETKSDLLDIFRENMEDIIEKHYQLYKKFKYIKEDMEDLVYDKR